MTKQEHQEWLAEVEKNHGGGGTTYHINEIFHSIQGEGTNSGASAVFLRFAHCNLSCSWCDTEYNSSVRMTAKSILRAMDHICGYPERDKPIVVCTGGEPSLQVDGLLVRSLSNAGFDNLTMETNGIRWNDAMRCFDTLSVSPKTLDGWWRGATPYQAMGMDLKVVYDPDNPDLQNLMEVALRVPARGHFLQPLEDQETHETNVQEVIAVVLRDPRWKISIQTHKVLGLP